MAAHHEERRRAGDGCQREGPVESDWHFLRRLSNLNILRTVSLGYLCGFLVWCVGGCAQQNRTSGAAMHQSAVLFLDDFESGVIDATKWSLRVGGAATIQVQQEKALHGKSALMVNYPQGMTRSYAFISSLHLDPALNDHLFGRVYVYVDEPALPTVHSVFLLAGRPGFPISNFLEVGEWQQRFQLSYQANAAGIPRGQTVIQGAPIFPTGKWVCLEWEFRDKPDGMTVWVDGQQTDQVDFAYKGSSTGLVGGFAEFSIGFRCWGNVPTPTKVYFDDLAIGTERIGAMK
jgi:hypothetical protein